MRLNLASKAVEEGGLWTTLVNWERAQLLNVVNTTKSIVFEIINMVIALFIGPAQDFVDAIVPLRTRHRLMTGLRVQFF